MTDIAIRIGYLIGATAIGLYIYYWSSSFKKLGVSSLEDLNEDEFEEDEIVDESETRFINYFGTTVFILIGFFIWAYLGTTIGKIAADITNHGFLKWVCYFFMYFIFLRFPFGVGSKMVKKSYDFERFPEKIIFSITMISFYILAICCFDSIPDIFKWHLMYLN